MHVLTLKLIVRSVLALALGWLLLLVPMGVSGMLEAPTWGLAHYLVAILSLPFTFAAAFWFLGFLAGDV